MRRDFFPDRETDMLSWTANFARLLGEQYASLGVSAEAAAEYADVVARFAEAYRVANAPETRTSIAVRQKNEWRREVERLSRGLARQVGGNMKVTDEQRLVLGLNIRKKATRKIEAADVGPNVAVLRVTGATVNVALSEFQGPNKRAKPSNAASATIFACQSQTQPPTGAGAEHLWRFVGSTTRTSLAINFGAKYPPGTRVWLMARWNSPRGEASGDGYPMYACLGEGSTLGGDASERVLRAA